jgi:hypothetical protein
MRVRVVGLEGRLVVVNKDEIGRDWLLNRLRKRFSIELDETRLEFAKACDVSRAVFDDVRPFMAVRVPVLVMAGESESFFFEPAARGTDGNRLLAL